MARPNRSDIVSKNGGFYHVLNRIAGPLDWFPFGQPTVGREWFRRLRYSLAMSCIEAASFTLMGNHFHLIVFVQKFRELARQELEHFAKMRWGRLWKLRTRFWSDKRWAQFNEDLFCLDVFMRDFQGPFATWFNKRFKRRGHLWADRYKSLNLKGFKALQECLYYIELNPVRAGLSQFPEDWRWGSAYLRNAGEDQFLMPLERLFPDVSQQKLRDHYVFERLYRGMNPTKENQASISAAVALRRMSHDVTKAGIYLTQKRFLTDGLILGSATVIKDHLMRLRQKGVYKRRKNPVPQLGGLLFTVREQRRHAHA